jgi:hypothetical protein
MLPTTRSFPSSNRANPDCTLCCAWSRQPPGEQNAASFRACLGRGVAAIRPFFANQSSPICQVLYIWRLGASIIAKDIPVNQVDVQLGDADLPEGPHSDGFSSITRWIWGCDAPAATTASRSRQGVPGRGFHRPRPPRKSFRRAEKLFPGKDGMSGKGSEAKPG